MASLLIALDYDWKKVRIGLDKEGGRAWTEIVGGNGVIIIDPEDGTCYPFQRRNLPERYKKVD